MKLATYPYIKIPEGYYEFYSEGPNGRIKKVVEYYRLDELEPEIFNLAFGDWNDENHQINVFANSNNADRDKVLATVAATVIAFMKDHPDSYIIATGGTLSRTRLYQIGIGKMWAEIDELFEILGLINDTWQLFKKGVNYDAFLLKTR